MVTVQLTGHELIELIELVREHTAGLNQQLAAAFRDVVDAQDTDPATSGALGDARCTLHHWTKLTARAEALLAKLEG
jgi:hypothetical protein